MTINGAKIFNEGVWIDTLSYVLDNMQKRVKKECLKLLILSSHRFGSKKTYSYGQSPAKLARSYPINALTPVTLSGVIVPWSEQTTDGFIKN